MKTSENLVNAVKQIIANGKWFVQCQYGHPENVTQQQLDVADESATNLINDATDVDIQTAIENCDSENVATIMSTLADSFETSGRETICVVVYIK